MHRRAMQWRGCLTRRARLPDRTITPWHSSCHLRLRSRPTRTSFTRAMTVRYNWPSFKTLPYPVYFRYDEFDAQTAWVPHRHDWGTLNYVANGVMQLEIEGARYLSPPQYAVWIPPRAAHASFNAHEVIYRSVYIDASLANVLPSHAATLRISGLLRAILSDFAERGVASPAPMPTNVWRRSSSINWPSRLPNRAFCRRRIHRRSCASCRRCRASPATTVRSRNGRRQRR